MSALKPDTDDTHDLGSSALRWRNLYVHDIDIATNIATAGSFIFEGGTADAHETTFGVVDPTADATINLPAMSAGTYHLPVLAAASTTSITSTPTELNLLDAGTSGASVTLATGDALIIGDADASNASKKALLSDVITLMESSSGLDAFANAISISDATAASSDTTGALKVTGGISTQADLYVGDDLVLESDSAELVFGADKEVKLVHTDGTGLHLNGGMRLAFRDQGGEYIASASDNNLKIAAGTTLNLVSTTIDVDGALDVSGTSVLAGNVTIGGGVGATGVTITDAGAISADARIITNDTTDATNGTDGSLQTDGGLSVAKAAYVGTDLTVTDDIYLVSDSAQIDFGENSDINLIHVADTGLVLEGAHANGTNFRLNNTAGDGDARVEFQLSGTTAWSVGVEDGDSDKFVIERGSGALGAAPALEILSDGTVAVKGNLTVAGTTTTVDTVTMEAANAIVFEGATADANETTLTISDPDSDQTITLPNQTGHVALLASEATAASVAVTPAEFALLDGGSTVGTTAVAGGDGILTNDSGTMKQTSVDTFDTYFSGTSKTLTNKTISAGTLDDCTVTTGLIPTAADGAALGSAAKQFSDLFLADSGVVKFGNEQDITLTHVADTGLTMACAHANGTNLRLNNTAGDGDARIELQLDGTTAWSVGVEDGDSDKFVIEDGAGALGADPAFEIAADKSAKFFGTLEATTSFTIGNAVMSEADLEQLDGITAGTAAASKAVVLDSNADTNGIRNLTISGTFSDGNYTFDDSGNVTGLGNITSTGTITAATAILPDASGGADLGSTSLEWGDLYIADDKAIQFGSNQDAKIEYDEDGTDQLRIHAPAAGVVISGTTPTLVIGDAGAEDTKVVFDGNAQDFYVGLDDTDDKLKIGLGSAVGTTPNMTLYSAARTVEFGGNVVIPDSGTIGSASDTDAVAISSGGVVTLSATTTSSDKDTGALVVQGGVGIEGALHVGNSSGATIIGTTSAGFIFDTAGNEFKARNKQVTVADSDDNDKILLKTNGEIVVEGTADLKGDVNLGNAHASDATNVHSRLNVKGKLVVGGATGETKKTISSGAITPTQPYHTVEVEGESGDDDLTTISGSVTGQVVILQAFHTGRTVTVQHGTGNIQLHGGANFDLDNTECTITLIYNGTNWCEIGRADI